MKFEQVEFSHSAGVAKPRNERSAKQPRRTDGALVSVEPYLGRHDLGVRARDGDSGVETCAVVRLHDVTSVHLVGTHTTVVGACSDKSHECTQLHNSTKQTNQGLGDGTDEWTKGHLKSDSV